MAKIDEVHSQLVKHYFERRPNPLINGICIGYLPRSDSPQILVLLNPSAAKCEQSALREEIEELAQRQPFCLRPVSRFVGLQMEIGASISLHDPLRHNVPPMSAGSLGSFVKIGGKRYILGSNHVLAHNGRAPQGTLVVTPGPMDDANAGSAIAKRAYFVELQAPGWPDPGAPANQVDCALAEVTGEDMAPKAVPVLSFSEATPDPFQVSKTGRATLTTQSQVRLFSWHGPIDFSFGTYYFKELIGTYDEDHTIFAAPGDSGSLALDEKGKGVGLITARGYAFSDEDEFVAYMVLICPLSSVRSALAPQFGISQQEIEFFR